jgi:hypothetical protein
MPCPDEPTEALTNQIKVAVPEVRVPAPTIFATAPAPKTSNLTSAKPPHPKGPTIPTIPTIQAINKSMTPGVNTHGQQIPMYPNPLLFQPRPIERPSVPVYSPTGSGSLLPPTQEKRQETAPLGKKQKQEDVRDEEHNGGKDRAASPSEPKDIIHAAAKKMKVSPHPSTSNASSTSSSRQAAEDLQEGNSSDGKERWTRTTQMKGPKCEWGYMPGS